MIVHDTVQRCTFAKKMAQQWQLQSHESDLFLDGAVTWLKGQQDLDASFQLSEIPKALLNKTDAAAGTATPVKLMDTLAAFREVAFDFMSQGQMKTCYSENQQRRFAAGLQAADANALKTQTLQLTTWYLYMLMRQVQYNANAKWKDVVGENIDFAIDLTTWPDLSDAQKTDLKDIEKSILEGVGQAFKVIESNITDESKKKLFVQYYRRFLDTQVYIYFACTTGSSNIYNKLAPNIIELKADGNLVMGLLMDLKFFSGDEMNQLKVIKAAINQVGNALESAYIWVAMFKRDHDDTKQYKKVVDDFSQCSLINYRYKIVDHAKKAFKIYKEIIKDAGTSPDIDNTFFTNVAKAQPEQFLDAISKNGSDIDPDDTDVKKAYLKKLEVYKIFSYMLMGPINNLMITHSQDKADTVYEMSAVGARYKQSTNWIMKHNKKIIENKLWICKGCGGVFAIDEISRSAKQQMDVALAATDKNQFKVAHRIVASSSMVISYKRLFNYKFEKLIDDATKLISDMRSPFPKNKKLFGLISVDLKAKSQENIKFTNIQRDVFYLKKNQPDIQTAADTMAGKINVGQKVQVFKEIGKTDSCIKGLIDHGELIMADKYEYMQAVVAKKDADVSATKLPGCQEIILKKAPTLKVEGETQLHYPIFMSRNQEFKKKNILDTFRSPYLSEGLEDTANMEGLSYITFGDVTGMDAQTYDAGKFNGYLEAANDKRDISAQGFALENDICVYKNDKERTIASYVLKNLSTPPPDITTKFFNNSEKIDGVDCKDLDKLLKFDSLKDFNETIKTLDAESPNLGSFVTCGSFRKTVKQTSKKDMLYLVSFSGKIKEKMIDKKTPKIQPSQYLHARISSSFLFRDQLDIKLMPAHWLKIKPIKLGANNSYLIITVLTRIAPASKFLGLASMNSFNINPEPAFEFPSFDKGKDYINAHLSSQLFTQGISLKKFNENLGKLAAGTLKNFSSYREFVKILYDHNVAEGCDSKVKGLSVMINNDYKVVESCGTNPLPIDKNYYIEVIFLDTKEAEKNRNLPDKFIPPTDQELATAGNNGQVLYNAGKKLDELDLKFGFMRFRIWARPIMMMPQELNEKKS